MRKKRNGTVHSDSYPSITQNAPFEFVESYNSIRTNIRFASVSRSYQKIVITSSIAGEGKSTVAVNLAAALSNSKSRVLLIDCDLRKPVIQSLLRIPNEKAGLSTALAGLCGVEECISRFEELGLDVIPSGPVPPNPAELLGSSKMSEMVDLLSQRYDYILFDTSPVSIVTDAAVLSKLSDGVVLVVRQRYTTIDDTRLAVENLNKVGATVIGTILNNFKSERGSKAYKHGYYKRYGYESRNQPAPLNKRAEVQPSAAGE